MKKNLRLLASALGGAAGAVGALAYQRYRRETANAMERLTAESQVLNLPSGPLEYAETGDGPPVLISHGSGGGYDQGLIMRRLLGAGCRYIAPSRFGYLRSPLPADATPQAQARAFVELLDALGLQRAAIFGISAGGPTAIAFALAYPERCAALILSAAAVQSAPTQPPQFEAIAELAYNADFAFWAFITYTPHLMLSATGLSATLRATLPAADQHLLNDVLRTMLPMHLRSAGMKNDVCQIIGSDLAFPLENVAVPTLILHAKDDPLAPFAAVERAVIRIPKASFVPFEQGGHFGMMLKRAELATVVRYFVQINP